MQEGNEGLVHHLLIYECHGKFNQSLYGSGFDCHNTANMPLTQCYHSSVVAAWAVGGEVRAIGLALKTILNKMANVLFPLSFFPIFRPFFFATLLLSFLVVFVLSVSFVILSLSRHFITRQKLVIQLELRILRAATCSSCTMTTRMALKVRTVVHNDLLLLIMILILISFHHGDPSIYLHVPLGSHIFLSYVTISLLHLNVYGLFTQDTTIALVCVFTSLQISESTMLVYLLLEKVSVHS